MFESKRKKSSLLQSVTCELMEKERRKKKRTRWHSHGVKHWSFLLWSRNWQTKTTQSVLLCLGWKCLIF